MFYFAVEVTNNSRTIAGIKRDVFKGNADPNDSAAATNLTSLKSFGYNTVFSSCNAGCWGLKELRLNITRHIPGSQTVVG